MTTLLIRAPSNWYERKKRRELHEALKAYVEDKRNPPKEVRKAERKRRFITNGGGE